MHYPQLLEKISSAFAKVSYSFRRARETQHCAQICTRTQGCAKAQISPYEQPVARKCGWATFPESSSDLREFRYLQGWRQSEGHLLIEGGAANLGFSVALKRVLATLTRNTPISHRLAGWTYMFGSLTGPRSRSQSRCFVGETDKNFLPNSQQVDSPICEKLRWLIKENESRLMATFPSYTNSIRAFNQNLLQCQYENSLVLVELNHMRLQRLISSNRFAGDQCPPLLEIKELVEWLLGSIPLGSRKFTSRIFLWLSFANRVLKFEELSAALLIGWNLPSAASLSTSTEVDQFEDLEKSITELCGGLVIIEKDQSVCFIDPCVRQHLISDQCGWSKEFCSVDFEGAQELFALTCLHYLKLRLQEHNRENQDHEQLTRFYCSSANLHFLQYASDNWIQHCQSAEAKSYYVVGALQEYLQEVLLCQLQPRPYDGDLSSARGKLDLRNPMLRECARHGFTELGAIYQEMGANVNETNDAEGLTPLALALNNQHWETAASLIKQGASLNQDTRAGCGSVLHRATACGRSDIIKFLLSHGANPNKTTLTTETALHWAVLLDRSDAVRDLIDGGSDINRAVELTGETPLHFTAMFGYEKTIKVLLEVADLEARSSENWTALHYAAAYGHAKVARLLIEHGASLDLKTSSGTTAFFLATYYGHKSVRSMILSCSYEKSYTLKDHGIATRQQLTAGKGASFNCHLADHAIGKEDAVEIIFQSSETISKTPKQGSR